MSGYDCRNKCVFSFRRNIVNDEADVMSSGRHFTARSSRSEWSFANCDKTRQTDSKLVGSWPPKSTSRRHISNAAQPIRQAPRREELARQWPPAWTWFARELVWQWKLSRVSMMWAERRRPAIDRAAALSTVCWRLSKLAGRPTNVALPQSNFDSTRAKTMVW